MARDAAPRELSTRFAVATSGDDAAIRRLLRENPMRGAISLTFEREPDYFRGENVAGSDDQTIVAFADSQLVCMGRCTRRECWVDGRAMRVGYLGELRLHEAARGRFGIVRDGYRFFHALQRDEPAELYFTAIAADNERARRLLESGARGLPTYRFLSEFVTLLIAVPPRPRAAKLKIKAATPENVPEMLRVMNGHARRHQLAAVWSVEKLRVIEEHGLPLDRFLLALEAGKIIACGALWDQRCFRQTVIHGYSRALSAARPFLNLASRFLQTPRLPRPGSALAHAFLSPLGFAEGAKKLLPEFVESLFPLAARNGVEFLTLGLPATDARLPALRRRFSTRTWRSRLYRVDWPGQTPFEFSGNGAAFLPEVALL